MLPTSSVFAALAASSIALSGVAFGADRPDVSPVLIGTYTAGTSEGIYLYDFDSHSGKFGATPVQVTRAENPSWLAFSADHHRVYAVAENGAGQRDVVGRIAAYEVQPGTGRLTFVNTVPSLGSEPAHASLSNDGRYVFVSNYSVLPDPGGTLAVVPVTATGALGPVTQVKTSRASQVDPARQLSPHVHSSVSSPDGRFVYVQDLGADRILAYRYDPSNPESPLTAMKEQPSIALPPGSGPRHLIFSRDGRHAYLTLEMAGKVVMFDYANGTLTKKQVLPLAADDFQGEVASGGIHLSGDGRFLYVADRGEDNQLVAFRVDAGTGMLTFIGRRSVEGKEPREFALDPSGRFVIVANQGSHQLVVFRRDPATGLIGSKVQALEIDQPSDVKFVAMPTGPET